MAKENNNKGRKTAKAVIKAAVVKPIAKVAPSVEKKERVPRIIEVAHKIPDFSKQFDLSCPDWETRIKTRSTLMPTGLLESLDQERAEKAVRVFNKLSLPDVPGSPTLEEAGGEWFREIVRAVFGSWNGSQRCINEFFVEVPKKNSKTTNAAGIMTTAMIRSERPRAEFLLIAPTQQVSSIAFAQALGMVEGNPKLKEMCKIQDYVKKITFLPNKCTLRIKSFDPAILTGIKPAGVLLDELHVIAEHSSADRVLGQIRGGLISQPEGFLITITTQSERVPSGVFRTELMKARKVRDGLAPKLKILPIIYELPDEFLYEGGDRRRPSEKWKDPSIWDMVTPNNGRSITVARLVEDYDNAVEAGEEELRRWASQHLNIEIGMALKSDHWTAAKLWLSSGTKLTLEDLLERCEVIDLGIDGGGLDDMLAITACGRDAKTKQWLTWSRAWLNTIALERRKGDIQVYRDFEKDGDLIIIEQLGEDVEQLGDIVDQVKKSGLLDKVGVDPSGLGMILDKLEELGLDPEKDIVGISQGWRLSSAIKTTERKLAEGVLKHADQPLTRWAVENARVEPRGNAILITKQVSGSAKIDPLMATFNAVELMSQNPAAKSKEFQVFFIGGES